MVDGEDGEVAGETEETVAAADLPRPAHQHGRALPGPPRGRVRARSSQHSGLQCNVHISNYPKQAVQSAGMFAKWKG